MYAGSWHRSGWFLLNRCVGFEVMMRKFESSSEQFTGGLKNPADKCKDSRHAIERRQR